MKNSIRARRRAAMKSPARVWANTSGKRCRTFSVGCITCACWHHFDMRGFFPRSFDDAYQYNETLTDMHDSGRSPRYETDGVAWADAGKYGPDAYNREMDARITKALQK